MICAYVCCIYNVSSLNVYCLLGTLFQPLIVSKLNRWTFHRVRHALSSVVGNERKHLRDWYWETRKRTQSADLRFWQALIGGIVCNTIYKMDSKIDFEMSLIVIEAIRGRCYKFIDSTATVSVKFGGQTQLSLYSEWHQYIRIASMGTTLSLDLHVICNNSMLL